MTRTEYRGIPILLDYDDNLFPYAQVIPVSGWPYRVVARTEERALQGAHLLIDGMLAAEEAKADADPR